MRASVARTSYARAYAPRPCDLHSMDGRSIYDRARVCLVLDLVTSDEMERRRSASVRLPESRSLSACARVNFGSTEHKRCGCPVSVMIDDETMVVNKLLFSWALVFTTFEVVIVVRRFRYKLRR